VRAFYEVRASRRTDRPRLLSGRSRTDAHGEASTRTSSRTSSGSASSSRRVSSFPRRRCSGLAQLSIDATRTVQDALEALDKRERTARGRKRPAPPDFRRFRAARPRLELGRPYFAGTSDSPIPDELAQILPQSSDVLRPDFAVRDREPQPNRSPWQLLVRTLARAQSFRRRRSHQRTRSLGARPTRAPAAHDTRARRCPVQRSSRCA
jgi:hypothetical protein